LKIKKRYYLLITSVVLVLFSCTDKNRLPSLEETYSRSDKNPFGTYVAFREINEFFYRNDVRVKRTTVDKTLEDFSDTSSLFISISRHFYLRRTELSAMLNYVNRGNYAFISARDFDSSFLKEMMISIIDSSYQYYPAIMDMRYTGVELAETYFTDQSSYKYYYNPIVSSFNLKKGNADMRVLGRNDYGEPNFIVIFHGKGRFYLHCEPRAFSNYFLLQEKNYKYLQYVFSLMPSIPDNVFWDDFYNKRDHLPRETDDSSADGNDKSTLDVLFKYPSLKWAFWLIVLVVLLYLLFGGKRRQRIIKPIEQAENTSVAFTETIGRLYLQKRDNRNIADKMITYLLEYIRNQYFISTNNLNDDFTVMLSRKTNLPYEQLQKLMSTINMVQRKEKVEDELLLSLNQQIENFYKHKS
jgi:hypothetical protein